MITVANLTKRFKLYRTPSDRLKEIFLRRSYHKEFVAVDNVSFRVGRGETLGIVGRNGAGKSTLLKLLSGVLLPESGSMIIEGRMTGLLELGTGFNSEFTGSQNILMNGTYLGLSRYQINERIKKIIAFSELGDFIHEPIKTYSSGMVMRLAFSIAIHADPVCFLVDEALSVGDAHFQQKCIQRIKQFKSEGGSIIFVSHDMNAVKVLCDNAILMEHGSIIADGSPDNVINEYNYMLAKATQGESIDQHNYKSQSYGNRKVQIKNIELLTASKENAEVITSGSKFTIVIKISAMQNVSELSIGLMIRDRFGQDIFGTNSFHLGKAPDIRKGEQSSWRFTFNEFNLGPGKYTITVAAHRGDTHVAECFEWIDYAKSFEVVSGSSTFFTGLIRLSPSLEIFSESKG